MGVYHSRTLRGRVSISTRKSQHRLLTILVITILSSISAGGATSLAASTHAPDPPTQCPGEQFIDVCPGDWFYADVMGLHGLNAITGYPDQTFRPGNTVVRGQLMKIVVIALDLSGRTPGTATFVDVPAAHPFFSWIEIGVANEVINGYDCGSPGEPCDSQHRPYFRPSASATRGHVSKIIMNAQHWDPYTPQSPLFTDVPPTHPYYGYVNRMAVNNIINGYVCGGPGEPCDGQHRPYFRPANTTTRAQASKMTYGAYRFNEPATTNTPIEPSPTEATTGTPEPATSTPEGTGTATSTPEGTTTVASPTRTPTTTRTAVPPSATRTAVPPSATRTRTPTPNTSRTATPTPTSSGAGIVWSASMETGNLSQWTISGTHGGSYDSGDCIRPSNGVSTQYAHSGNYSMKMSIDTSSQESGCRQFRHEESLSGNSYYYNAWYYLPENVTVANYWNVFQFKSESPTQNDPFWVLDILNRPGGGPINLVLRWKGVVPGPHSGEGTALRYYRQSIRDVPIGQWFHIEAYLRQAPAGSFTGQLIIWQDGVQLFDMDQVVTKYAGGDQRWSVNNYSDDLNPSIADLYVDDAVVSTTRLSP